MKFPLLHNVSLLMKLCWTVPLLSIVPVVGTVMREGYDYSYLGDLSGIENVGAPIPWKKHWR